MRAAEVYFMGGPAHGELRAVPAGDDGIPPLSQDVLAYNGGDPKTFRYVRQVSQTDDGPLWVYVPEEP